MLLLAWLALVPAWTQAAEPAIRPSALAGTWYPAQAAELTTLVKKFLAQAKPPAVAGRLTALIVPHAGYDYSGQVAAQSFARLQGQSFDTVIMIGPSHRARFSGVALDRRHYQTPLGVVKLDEPLANAILARDSSLITANSEVHDQEHCLEIELPFLQTVRPQSKIVPLLMGTQDLETCRRLAAVLADLSRNRPVLLLASTDLSHYHPAEQAEEMDGRLVNLVKAGNPEGLHAALAAGQVEACGGGPLVAVMMAARTLGADRPTILKYAHSGETSGDRSRVVGYLAAALSTSKATDLSWGQRLAGLFSDLNATLASDVWAAQTKPTTPTPPKTGVDLGLSRDDLRRLLTIARESIMAALDKKDYRLPTGLSPRLSVKRGAFVTLKKDGELRGCIGRIQADGPVADTVALMAQAAALHDPRFPPLTKAELPGLTVELSVLTPFELVKDIAEIKIGLHGLLVVQGSNQGLLLPQVPVEEGWNREQFLDNACRKAGLPSKSWQDKGTKLFKFSAQIFGEDPPHIKK